MSFELLFDRIMLSHVALYAEEHSDDPYTKTACFITDAWGEVIAREANRIPNGIQKLDKRLRRPLKYEFIEHAERGCIYNLAEYGRAGSRNGRAYVRLLPCTDCARGLIRVGITRLVVDKTFNHEYMARARAQGKEWNFDITLQMFAEAGVTVDVL